jgi:hypothetical protein
MTKEELDALPDVTPGFVSFETVKIDGRRVNVPALDGFCGALFIGPDDGTYFDASGAEWTVGWHKGQRVKRRARSVMAY